MTAEIRVKGTVLAGLVRGSGAHAPGAMRDKLVGRVKGDLLDAVQTNTLMPTAWYPVSWHREVLGFVAAECGAAMLCEAVRRSTRENVGTVHRVLMRAFSPDTLMTRTARIFSTFFEAECNATLRAPGLTVVQWSKCHGFDGNCWLAQLQTVDELVSMTGAKQTRRKVLDGGRDGDPGMTLEIGWR